MKRTKKFILFLILAGGLYFCLSYHFVIVGKSVKLLKKSELTLEHTFVNTNGRTNKALMKIDQLREDGLGELLVELGRMSEEEKQGLTELFEGN
jgi:hypothetical protein